MADRFPGYDVLAKHDTPSWNAATRTAVDARLALPADPDVLTPQQRATLRALAERVVPQPEGRAPVNTVAVVLDKIGRGLDDGFRPEGLPLIAEAWARGLDALEREAQARHGKGFAELDGEAADTLLRAVEHGDVQADWQGLDPQQFWTWRLIPDLVSAYWSHPSAWSAMGFGGPASPRGYVRLDANRRDPWEAAERGDGRTVPAKVRNRHVR